MNPTNTGIIALRLTADELSKLESMMSETKETNKSKFIRNKLFAEPPASDNPCLSSLTEEINRQKTEQLNAEIIRANSEIEFLKQQIATKDTLLSNQQLIQIQTQALLIDKSKVWYKPWTWSKKTAN